VTSERRALGDATFGCVGRIDNAPEPSRLARRDNAWPHLFVSARSGFMRTQPLLRMIYSPLRRTSPIPIRFDIYSSDREADRTDLELQDWFLFGHEMVHCGLLDQTPAKDLLRWYLARAFASLVELMTDGSIARQRAEKLRDELIELSSLLRRATQSIEWTEESIASAFNIVVTAEEIRPGGMWAMHRESAEYLVNSTHTAQRKAFNSVFDRDFPRVVRLVDQIRGGDERAKDLRSIVMATAQPVILDRSGTRFVADNGARFANLLTTVDQCNSRDDLLISLVDSATHDVARWRALLQAQLEVMRDDDETSLERYYLRQMWELAGREVDTGATLDAADLAIARAMSRHRDNPTVGAVAIISPTGGRHPFDVSIQMMTGGDLPQSQVSSLELLYAIEGIRQQLLMRTAIVCPMCVDETGSQCSDKWCDALDRLSGWIAQGLFGPAEWRLLPHRAHLRRALRRRPR